MHMFFGNESVALAKLKADKLKIFFSRIFLSQSLALCLDSKHIGIFAIFFEIGQNSMALYTILLFDSNLSWVYSSWIEITWTSFDYAVYVGTFSSLCITS